MNDEGDYDPFLRSARRYQTPDELADAHALAAGIKVLLAGLDERLSDDVAPDWVPDRPRGG